MSQPDIHLYTAATMNGYKPVVFLEEAGVPYELTFIDFAKRAESSGSMAMDPSGTPARRSRADLMSIRG